MSPQVVATSVPGGGAGALTLRSTGFSGEDDGPDRVSGYLLRVLSVKLKGCSVFFFSLWVPHVILYAPLD